LKLRHYHPMYSETLPLRRRQDVVGWYTQHGGCPSSAGCTRFVLAAVRNRRAPRQAAARSDVSVNIDRGWPAAAAAADIPSVPASRHSPLRRAARSQHRSAIRHQSAISLADSHRHATARSFVAKAIGNRRYQTSPRSGAASAWWDTGRCTDRHAHHDTPPRLPTGTE